MDVEDAIKLLLWTDPDSVPDNGVLHGLQFLAQFYGNLHDYQRVTRDGKFCITEFSKYIHLMNEEQVTQMAYWGWWEENDRWVYYVN